VSSLYPIPLRTHLLTPGEDLKEVVVRYTGRIAKPGDIIAIAETVVAITQGRMYLPEEIRPGPLARFLSRFPGKGGNLTSPPAMEVAIRQVGVFRILLGALVAGIGKLIGKRGLFFYVTGPKVRSIDDVSGTAPPFERYIIAGPEEPDRLAEEIRQATGLRVLITDVNDLGCVNILGQSQGFDQQELAQCMAALRSNPFGNADEQTPFVLLRKGEAGA
jgi:hypothetical protein